MSNISIIPSITCKVECGTERGTAFFVDAHRLLTAFHVVGSALNGNLIYVEIEKIAYECELTIVEPNKDIALLKLKDETVTHEYGSLLSMPIEAKTHFRFWGYPNTLIGEAVGQSVKIRVDETYVALLRDFDAYAVFEDEKHLTEYAGFSGSPVYADSDKIIGIVTNILDSHIGFISIKSVEEKLKALGVTIDSDYVKFQEVSYGRKESIKKLHEQIKLAGNRYKPNLDVPNQSLTTLFANLCDIQALKEHKEILHKSKQVFLNLQRSNPRLFDTPADGTLSDLDYNIGRQRDVWRLKNRSDTSDWKTVEVALKEESLSWEQINESMHYVVSRREKAYCISMDLPAVARLTMFVVSPRNSLKKRMCICVLAFSSTRIKEELLLKFAESSTSKMKTIWRGCRKKQKMMLLISVPDVMCLSLMRLMKVLMIPIGARVWEY